MAQNSRLPGFRNFLHSNQINKKDHCFVKELTSIGINNVPIIDEGIGAVQMKQQTLSIYRGKNVLITGHTGFKGGWLSLWLSELGASVYGYALEPPTNPSLFNILGIEQVLINHQIADVRNISELRRTISNVKPDIIFHLAAQSEVIESYESPYDTVEINTMGSLNVLEAVRLSRLPMVVIMVTTDKCYENKEWVYGYRETDPIGGYDPYSASKGAAELLISSWRNSFFHPSRLRQHGVRIASVRAGNVIGGGDWTTNALVPDCIRSLQENRAIPIRSPYATRPWQHVLEPLSGYLELGKLLLDKNTQNIESYCEAFNFGPSASSNKTVLQLVEKVIHCWGAGQWERVLENETQHEATLLQLCTEKAHHKLQWQSRWNFDDAVERTVEWYKVATNETSRLSEFTIDQIKKYMHDSPEELSKTNSEWNDTSKIYG
ncbi:CDP-glucose 4,6-dehydratase [soil metagenome]